MAAIAPAEPPPPPVGIIIHLNDYLSSTAKRAAAVEAQGRAAGRATAAPGWNHTHLNDYLSSTAKRTAAVEAQSKAAGLYNQIILLPLYCQEVIKTPKATPQKPRALGVVFLSFLAITPKSRQ